MWLSIKGQQYLGGRGGGGIRYAGVEDGTSSNAILLGGFQECTECTGCVQACASSRQVSERQRLGGDGESERGVNERQQRQQGQERERVLQGFMAAVRRHQPAQK